MSLDPQALAADPAVNAFVMANAGSGKTVQASGLVVLDSGGVDVTGNYAINYVGSAPSTITAASLSVTAPSVTKTYDGTTIAIGTATVGGLSGAGAKPAKKKK